MSVNGLKFVQGQYGSTPLETKSGSYIYLGDAGHFHDWEFRAGLRIALFESASAGPVVAAEHEDEESEDMPTFPDLSRHNTSKPPSTPSSGKAGGARSTSTKPVGRGPLVNKIVEGLRGDAFAIARDVGLDQLTAAGGLEHLITQIKAHVFPRAQEEAKELFRAGRRIGGPLVRESLEPTMLSYTQRRRRWWKTLIELDPLMQLSDSLRMELMLELSGLSRQEGRVIQACATRKD